MGLTKRAGGQNLTQNAGFPDDNFDVFILGKQKCWSCLQEGWCRLKKKKPP
jgi:hypothetical protein